VTISRIILIAVSLIVAVALQLSLMSRLGLPGATPDLVLVVVMAFGFVRGPVAGAAIGFAAGLLLDLAPPSLGYFGLSAALLAVAGFAAGVVAERSGGVVAIALISVALAAFGLTIVRAVVATLVGDPRVLWGPVLVQSLTSAVYAVIMAALIVPLVAAIDRRLEPRAGL
jgi:hypothetical protein